MNRAEVEQELDDIKTRLLNLLTDLDDPAYSVLRQPLNAMLACVKDAKIQLINLEP